ncbi:glycine/D-amino acid oxidase-like deaminating enzyme [Kribbella sp. VKM Ac-2569]|uniref:NAD(P)/FAD-dependent oxidoreductase n=1 Tax=Kribbella sp. VKM Ac-2569 TaxID=2512220 RepID=UPI0010E00240|nr:FAD-binding oxidoreductase [Kribbella sp. VKM Ac-2569]RZT27540.1 glycine/D-amino acid oxidase-like deaminating enzyme [Kribbella sp. VKM Ac-2569]
MKVIVIGAGVVGSATAYALAKAGARVTVCEAKYPGAGTSGESYAWINANRKEPREYFDLNVDGMRAHDRWHRDLAESAGALGQWLWHTGHLEWSTDPTHSTRLDEKLERMADWGYPADVLEPREALAVEPALRLGEGVDRVVSYPQEAFCVPELLISVTLQAARALGAEVLTGSEVTNIEHGDRAYVRLADGTVLDADVVVTCAGRWTGKVLASAGVDQVPMAPTEAKGLPTIGLLAYTRPRPPRLTRIVTTSRLNVRPQPDGGMVLHALDLDGVVDPAGTVDADGSLAADLLERLAEVVRLDSPAEIERLQIGRRSIPADGKTVSGFTGEGAWLYAIATHSGVTLAPLLADYAVQEIIQGNPVEQLAPFRPGRFATYDQQPATPRATVPGDQ